MNRPVIVYAEMAGIPHREDEDARWPGAVRLLCFVLAGLAAWGIVGIIGAALARFV